MGLPVTAFRLKAAAARVAVELREDCAGDGQRGIEMRGDVDGFLAGGGVEHEQNFLRLHKIAQADEFLHERLINLQPPGGVEDEGVAIIGFREVEGFAGDLQNVRLAAFQEHGDLDLFAERFELVHGRRTINVRGDKQRQAALLEQQFGELAGRGGLARTVQADHQDTGRIAGKIQRGVGGAEQLGELVGDDFDDLLAGLDAGDDFRAERLGFDALDEIARDLEIHVGLQQCHPHFAQGVAGVALGNFAEAAQVAKGVLELAA
jgi:hypothetical protein